MRPTGRLHLGHYFGALQNWLKLQEEFDCFYFVADWHALTTHYEDTSSIGENTLQIALDWLSVGLDPEKSTIFIQSSVLEHAELHVILSMITPLSWLERVPTYKEQIENLKDRDLGTYGFLGYPLLQTADILPYGEPRQELLVPVGEDQVPHVELSREIARRFNVQFGVAIDSNLYSDTNAAALKHLVYHVVPKLKGEAGESFEGAYDRTFKEYIGEIGFENFLEKAGPAKPFFKHRQVLEEAERHADGNAAVAGNRWAANGQELRQFYFAERADRFAAE